MKKIIISILTLLLSVSISSEEEISKGKIKQFNIPASSFVTPGFKFFVAGGNASHTHSPGIRHPTFESFILAGLIRDFSRVFNIRGGQFQRDNVIYDNFENYSYFNQPTEKISPIGKVSSSFTTKSGEWTFEVSMRAKNYSGNYVLGNNIPFEYYPGSIEYHWRENQYNIIRNHGINSFIMVQPIIGVREIRENYKRESDNPYAKNYAGLREKSLTYSQQAGLSFYFKIIENLKFKLTGKVFQPIGGGRLQSLRNDTLIDNNVVYLVNTQTKTKNVKAAGNEMEAEFSYTLSRFNVFLGFNYTNILKETNRDPQYIPTIVTNANLNDQYLRYFVANEIFESGFFSGDSSSSKDRWQSLKYFYFGLSVNF